MLFDSHAHYDDERFNDDRDQVILEAHKSGVSYILNASSSMESSVKSIQLAEKFDFVYASVGIHPHSAAHANDSMMTILAEMASNSKVVAIGETGLDYHYDFSPREVQKFWFAQHIYLARQLGLPLVIHDREAHNDVLGLVESEKAKDVGGVFHCYSGSVEMADRVLKNNFYISVGGVVTFKNARRLVEVVRHVPLDKLLIETDCPYMAPEPYRGRRNDSRYVRLVAEKIAEIKGLEFEEVAETTAENARRLFRINSQP